jgi:hypothetical protein
MTNDETDRAAAVAGVTSPPQAADIRDRWWWVEHSEWTDRMLTRLEQSGPTTKTAGLRRRGCLVWNTAPVPMVSLTETPLTGEPDAGNPPVRFGGRGGANPAIPTSIKPLQFVVPPLGGGRLKPALRAVPARSPAFRRIRLKPALRAVPARSPAFRRLRLKPALVRLRRRPHSGVEVPARPSVHRPVTEGYCVVATRGGELPEVNHPSVTT